MSVGFANEVAACAARLIVEEGMDYGAAKRRAARALGRPRARSAELPGNQAIEDEVRAYLALFCAETQPAELAALRSVAKTWMQRLAEFRPHLEGAVWRGTATRHNDIHLQLFCDDPKSAQIRLLNLGVDFSVGSTAGMRADSVDVLSFASPCTQLETHVMLHLAVHDLDDLRGALRPDGTGRARRGDLAALCKLEGQQ
ncbi:MAG: hypothetical protein JHC40_03990 [Burkholderiales bacterium]|jgi:hypothetical protein|nr:hypothetical protein [Burkholderiales bacterium]